MTSLYSLTSNTTSWSIPLTLHHWFPPCQIPRGQELKTTGLVGRWRPRGIGLEDRAGILWAKHVRDDLGHQPPCKRQGVEVAEVLDGQGAILVIVGWRRERRVEAVREGDGETDLQDTGHVYVNLEHARQDELDTGYLHRGEVIKRRGRSELDLLKIKKLG